MRTTHLITSSHYDAIVVFGTMHTNLTLARNLIAKTWIHTKSIIFQYECISHQFYVRYFKYLALLTRPAQLLFGIMIIIICMLVVTIMVISTRSAASADSEEARVYGCSGPTAKIKCEAIETKFNSKQTTGHTLRMSTVNLTKFKPIEGVFGDSENLRLQAAIFYCVY